MREYGGIQSITIGYVRHIQYGIRMLLKMILNFVYLGRVAILETESSQVNGNQ